MITFVKGDIFQSKCRAITIPVNCVGVMGAGLALEMKKRFPQTFRHYKFLCDNKNLSLRYPHLYLSAMPYYILLFPTKHHWKDKSNIRDVIGGLNNFADHFKDSPDLTSISFPALGCGLGELDWNGVKNAMEIILSKMNIPVEIYEPL